MKFQILLLSLLSGSLASVLAPRACNADNCARAVTGTGFPLSIQASHTADCSSFLIKTVTPAVPTITVHANGTSTSYSIIGSNVKRTAVPEIEARQATTVAPNAAIPTYASACSGAARYSSACSCGGVTAQTITAPTPAAVTTTILAQATVVPVCDPSNNYGIIYIAGTPIGDAVLNPTVHSTTQQGCCALCYAQGSGCFAYLFQSGQCLITVENAGSNAPTDYCPFGIYPVLTESGPFYGLGPCGAPHPV